MEENVNRLESLAVEAARSVDGGVVVHSDFGGWNLLLDAEGSAQAILDWDGAYIGPREHDVWEAFEHEDPEAFLRS